MDDKTLGLVILISLTTFFAAFYYVKLQEFMLFLPATCLSTTLTFELIFYFKEGYISPFFLVEIFTLPLYSGILASALYVVFYIVEMFKKPSGQ